MYKVSYSKFILCPLIILFSFSLMECSGQKSTNVNPMPSISQSKVNDTRLQSLDEMIQSIQLTSQSGISQQLIYLHKTLNPHFRSSKDFAPKTCIRKKKIKKQRSKLANNTKMTNLVLLSKTT